MLQNPLKKIVELQKQGKNVGIYSVCSANKYVIEAALKRGKSDGSCVLIESTDGSHVWTTTGVSSNIIQACLAALQDSLTYFLTFVA